MKASAARLPAAARSSVLVLATVRRYSVMISNEGGAMRAASREARKRDSAVIVAFVSAAMFGFGPVSVGYFARIADLSSFSASLRATTLYFLAVYLVVAAIGVLVRARTPTIFRLWSALTARGRAHAISAGVANAISGWCFFDMLGRIDPLSAAVIMALATVFNLVAARLLLGEEIALRSAEGRRKWGAFLLILSGVLITSTYAYLRTGGGATADHVTAVTLLIAFASSLFAAVRTVTVKGTMNDYQEESDTGRLTLGLPLAVTRITYFSAFLFTLAAGAVAAAVDPNTPFTAMAVFRPNPFLPVLGIVYGGAYALNYIAMSRIEASRMALITRSAIVFTALYMVAMALLLHYGSIPSIVQAPAALLVISGSYLASHRRTREGGGGPGEGRVRGRGTGRLSRLRR